MDQFKYLNMSAKDLSLYDAQQQAVNTANSLPKVSTGRAASDGCAHCCSPLFAGRKCKNCGKVHWDDELHNAAANSAGACASPGSEATES